MANEAALNALQNMVIESHIRSNLRFDGIKSVIDVKIRSKKVKSKFLIFPYNKKVNYIEFTVDEPSFIMEVMVDDLRLDNYASSSKYELEHEIIYL